jgi:hypothetical protein
MKSINLIFSILLPLLMASCQVKEGTSGSSLFSGHLGTTNKFTLQTPSSGTRVTGDVITFNVTFPFDMTINTAGGDPRLAITIGATTAHASYVAQSDLKKLQFTYTILAAQNDTNGIDVTALELNGSTLKFDNNGTITDCDVSSITSTNLSNVKVDTSGPTITAFTSTNIPALYHLGDTISFAMTFSEEVYVTDTPKFVATLGTGGAVDVNYDSGSGSTLLIFSFDVASGYVDTDGYTFTSPISLGTATIKDAVGNNASLDFSSFVAAAQTYSATVDISGRIPYITNVSVPANGTYVAAQSLDFTLDFDRTVAVTGTPYITLTVGSTSRQAQYVSGTGTDSLVFRYTLVPGDVDSDGVTLATTITANSGTITDATTPFTSFFSITANNTFTVPTTAGILANSLQPQATTVTKGLDSTYPTWGTTTTLDNYWIIGQDLNITVGFNTNMYVTQTGGTPTLALTIGSTTRNATYLSGGDGQTSLVFRYTIQEGDLDTDGSIGIGSISLNGGVITDASLTNSLLTMPVSSMTTTYVDGVRPTISSVTAPVDATYSQVTPYAPTNMGFTVTWTEAVNLSATTAAATYVPLTIGASSVSAVYSSGNNTSSIIYRPSSLTGYNDTDGITVTSPLSGTATLKDLAGNTVSTKTFTAPTTTGVLVDTTAPTVTSITAITADGTYVAGQTIDYSVTFSESVTTSVAGGYPRISLVVGSTTRYLNPTASTTGTTHTFRYTIVSGDLDTNGVAITVNSFANNGTTAYARDVGRNNVSSTLTAVSSAGILVDAAAPTISSVTAPTNGTYDSGDTLSFTVVYSEAVTVTGTPSIDVSLTSGTVNFNYVSGSGTTTLTFSYTITSSDYDFDGLPSSISSITLNGGTIADSAANNGPSTFTAKNLSSIYITYPNTDLWAVTTSLTSRAVSGSPSISSAGAVTTTTCGITTCRLFNGDDSFTLGGALNNVETLFIVVKTPSAIGANHNLFSGDLILEEDVVSSVWDLSSTSATVKIGGTTYTGTIHDTNLGLSTTQIIQVDFDSPVSFGAGTLIDATFSGGIGEVMAISGTLSGAQKTNILTYLDNKY